MILHNDKNHKFSRIMEKRTRLKSWKEIAVYLDCGVRTAQRWEKQYSLPIYRTRIGGRVFAFTDELDLWQHKQISKTTKCF